MNIVVLSGSPRKNGNSVTLVNAFAKGASEAGHTVEVVDCTKINVTPMRFDPPLPDDGFTAIGKKIVQADCIVFATPLYYFGPSAQLKTVIDRFYTLNNPKEQMMEKQSVLLVAQAQPSANAAGALMMMIREIAHYYHWLERGSVIACDVRAPGDIEKTSYLEQAYNLGKSL